MIDDLCREVLRRLSIRSFIETGLYQGETLARVSKWFAEMHPEEFGRITGFHENGDRGPNPWNTAIPYPILAPASPGPFRVCSVELDKARADRVLTMIGTANPNVAIHVASSEVFLRDFVKRADGSCFFYLDAHWNAYWPLRDELAAILTMPRFVVCIDDFVVPGRPECGFDLYDGKPCGWETIADLFSGRPVRRFYPTRPNRDRRGWVLLVAGYSDEEMESLAALPELEEAA